MLRLPAPAPDTPTLSELRAAIETARADTPGRWGKMTCTQMLRHCRRFAELYLGRVSVPLPVRLLARAFGPWFLRRTITRSPTQTPRNMKTLGAIRETGSDDPSFEREREDLLTVLEEVAKLEGTHPHPLYGEMQAEDMIALVRHHTAHHANQFGLL